MSDLSLQAQMNVSRAQQAQSSSIAQKGSLTAEEAGEFAQTLAKEMALTQAAQAGMSSAGGMNMLSLYTPALLSSTAGQSVESQILMLLMMMTTGQADSSSMMAVLAQVVGSMQDTTEKERLRRNIMDSSYDNDALDQVDEGVFGGSKAAYPYEAWKATTPVVQSVAEGRSAAHYDRVISQFGVETNPRYQNNKKGTGDTYCNIFVWDVTQAMNAEIPHYVDDATGAPRTYPDVKGAHELSANGIHAWLEKYGAQYGWVRVAPEVAQAHANGGGPAVTVWRNNEGGSGHTQVVRPLESGEVYDPQRGVAVAQAGSKRLADTFAGDIFSDRAMADLRYYIHV